LTTLQSAGHITLACMIHSSPKAGEPLDMNGLEIRTHLNIDGLYVVQNLQSTHTSQGKRGQSSQGDPKLTIRVKLAAEGNERNRT
jgi:hypothetical protein